MLRGLIEDNRTQSIGDYIRRARQERELSAKACTAQGATAHLKLAHYYEALVARADIVGDAGSPADEDCSRFRGSSGIEACFPFESKLMKTGLASPRSHC
jgi:hypothetical protein